MKTKTILAITLGLLLVFPACLTVEYKEYTFFMNEDGSGKLTITYRNIASVLEDTLNFADKDFSTLISDYVNGDKISRFYAEADSIDIGLYVDEGELHGLVTVFFSRPEQAKLLKRGKKGAYYFCLATTCEKERLVETNGEYGSEAVPIIIWDYRQKELHLKTAIAEPDFKMVSLADHFTTWKQEQGGN